MPIEIGSFSLGAILGGLIVGLTNHFLAKSREKESREINEFKEAAKELRGAFGPELAALKSPSSDGPEDPCILLYHSFEKHRVAVNLFRLHLHDKKRDEFDKAWQNYYAYDDTGEDPFEYLVKYGPGWENTPFEECRDLAISNIEKLLEFTKKK